jgi:SAM-dependent methyltransferase
VCAAPWFTDVLRCPDCSGELRWDPGPACRSCARRIAARGRQLDCIVSANVSRETRFLLRQHDERWPEDEDPPDDRYRGAPVDRANPRHLAILARRQGVLDVLDWGCGSGAYRQLIERMGHRYVGVDLTGDAADILADAHSLPFASRSIDHVITGAVLEHVANPFLAVGEVARVLKVGGVFSGSVAFLEPYHLRSHFHLSPDGVVHALESAGLRVQALWPQEHWTVFDSLASMPGPVTAVGRLLLRFIAAFERSARRRFLNPSEIRTGRWLRRKSNAEYRRELLVVAGQVDFVAIK